MLLRKTSALALALAPFALTACFPESVDQPADEDGKFVHAKVPVEGEYIVVLAEPKGGQMAPTEVLAASTAMLAPLEMKAELQFTSALKGFSVTKMTEAQARALSKDPRVAYVQENGRVSISATQTNATWGLDRIDQRARPLNQTYTYNADGSGVTAYIIDTGIRATHSNFGGRVTAGFTSITDGQGTNDCHGHGTHVAGTVGSATYGVAKNVQLKPVRVLDCQGSGTDAGVIAGVDWVAANRTGPSVANMSLGGDASAALDTAIANLVNSGVTTVVAAGNETQNACNVSPAREPLAITVASTTSTDGFSSFSNFGSCVDIAGPGSSITSTWNTNDSATNTISGTSMASPHVCGGAALYLSANPTATPAQVLAALTTNATSGVLTGVNGSPNLLLYIGFIGGGGGNLPPTASITAPTNGSTVTGTITVSANAADSDGTVASVRFNLPDGTAVTDTTAPYSTTWNTATVANGARTISVTATDNAGATGSASVSVTVSNGGGGGGTSYSYSATNTASATQNTVNQVVALTAGQKITLGTCGLTGATFTGDTWLRFNGPAGTEVASNDDSCGGRGSSITYTATAAGNYTIRGGCYTTGACTGTVVWAITSTPPPTGGNYSYSATNTNSAQQNTVNQAVTLAAGQTIVLGTCGVTGGTFTGDTWLRLANPSGTQVGSNDDACGGRGSNLSYTATVAGTFQIRGGCYAAGSCTGTVAWTIQ
ncbi:MAG: S8 family serine peptidase [Myxococcales bacterium]|nr:S8 family serine peptidase [Myxococcales bacterium]